MSDLLEIELVPRSSWYENLRTHVSPKIWDTLRKSCYARAGNKCEICGGKGDRHPVECHEIWEYDDARHIQKLIGLISLCPLCHLCKHIGFATATGRSRDCIEHLMIVNNINRRQALRMVEDAFSTWRSRSNYNWDIDMSILDRLIQDAGSPNAS